LYWRNGGGGVIFFLAKRILFFIFVYDFKDFGYDFTRPNGNALQHHVNDL
jgi:hypothetical protein